MRINFRSKYSRGMHSGNSLVKNHHSGSQWSGMQEYSQGDARHIVWRKSTHHSIIEKTFEENEQISLIFFAEPNTDDNFTSEGMSKKLWKSQSIQLLEENASLSKIPHRTDNSPSLDHFFHFLLKKNTRSKLIIILSSTHPQDISASNLQKIASMNELIWILPLHPFEKNPLNTILMEDKIFDSKYQEAYLQELDQYQKSIKKFLSKYGIHFLIAPINTSISTPLQHFFKYQYE